MRAITGAVISSKRCTLAKAASILTQFVENSASILPSSDAATYLRTAAEATQHHRLFRLDLRRRYRHGDLPPPPASASPSASADKHRHPHSMEHHEAAAAATRPHVKHAVDLVAQGEPDKEMTRRKKKDGDQQEGIVEQRIASPEKKMNRNKHPEVVKIPVKDEKAIMVISAADLGSEKKRKKKRGRGDDNDNDKEQVEHTRKKPRNRS